MVVTSVFPDEDSSTVSTSTTSSCYTVTACTGSATTVKTTTSTATTVQRYCEPTSCGSACNAAKRRGGVVPTGVPKLDDLENQFETSNLTVIERDLPSPGTGDWSGFYGTLKSDPNTYVIDNDAGVDGTKTALYQVAWGKKKQNILVQDLYGCIAVIAVSHRGKRRDQACPCTLPAANDADFYSRTRVGAVRSGGPDLTQ